MEGGLGGVSAYILDLAWVLTAPYTLLDVLVFLLIIYNILINIANIVRFCMHIHINNFFLCE